MLKQTKRAIKRLPLHLLYGRWRESCAFEQGYTILLPSPMDMPFMLRLGLEGLKHIDTSNCRQILVVPDGWGDDRGAGLRQVAAEFDDPRIQFVQLRALDYRVIRAMRPPGCANTHWMMVVNGTLQARCEYAFLHDADAFFLDEDGLERQYQETLQKNMFTYGVEARWDPFFTSLDYQIPGTWELMYSTRWARSRSPMSLKPGGRLTPDGDFGFDSMLYAQYLDYATGKIGVMPSPPEFVHFNGTIFSFRVFRDAGGAPVTDKLFRVLLLSLIESALGLPSESKVCPPVGELANGLNDPNAPVQYRSDLNRQGYGEFRQMVGKLCSSPVFRGDRARIIEDLIRPFDRHFDYSPDRQYGAALTTGDVRRDSISDT